MLSADKSDSLDDDSGNDRSDSGSSSTCALPSHFEYFVGRVDDSVGHFTNSVGRVRGVGSDIFFPIGIDSIGDIIPLVVLVPIGVESKVGQLIEIFWCPKS